MAQIIRPDGTTQEVTPANGVDFTLDELYRVIGCRTIQVIGPVFDGRVPSGADRYLVMDEDAKLLDPVPPLNPKATSLARLCGIAAEDYVVGNVLVVSRQEMGP